MSILFGLILFSGDRSIAKTFSEADSHAIVIGIDRYRDRAFPSLNYAVRASKAYARFLEKQGFRVAYLSDEKATRENIRYLIKELGDNLQRGDRVVIYFAGHGFTGVSQGELSSSMIPHDGRADRPRDTFISFYELEYYSELMQRAKHQLFIFNSVWTEKKLAGDLPRFHVVRVRGESLAMQAFQRGYDRFHRRGRQVLTAGETYGRLWANDRRGESAFTNDLIEGVESGRADENRDGYVTVGELHNYVSERSARYRISMRSRVARGPSSRRLETDGGGEMAFNSLAMPAFPMRPPKWTSRHVVPNRLVVRQASVPLGIAFDRLIKALDRAGIEQRSVYTFGDEGFAVVAQLENIDEQGRPKPGKRRWVDQRFRTFEESWSLEAIIAALFRAKPGRYRVIVLGVTPEPVLAGKDEPSKSRMVAMLQSGAGDLPDELRDKIPSAPVKCHALIYEFFSQSEDDIPVLLSQSHLSAQRHLVGAGLWSQEEVMR